MEENRKVNKIVALVVFGIAFLTYVRTVAPTTSFWDCGEFITSSYIMGVMHPPGAPLFVIIGRLFTFLPWGDVGWRVNMISVIASALTVMFLYLIIVRLIREWRGEPRTLEDRIVTYASGVIGALAFAFSDSFWFNAVEAEVYAMSMLFTSLVVWLILLWTDNAEDYRNEKLILLIVYLFGLASGVHLLSLLVFPSILILILFQKNETVKKVSWLVLLQIAVPIFLYILIFNFNPEDLTYPEMQKHQAKAWKFFQICTLIVLIVSLTYIYYKDKRAFKLWWFVPLLIVIGYSTYLIIFIRSGLDPAIDQNNPENWQNLQYYLSRKQYGTESTLLTMFYRKAPFWSYQLKKMYIRYFGWQFIGTGTTLGPGPDDRYIQETISLRGLLGIPFIVGLMGVIHHFFKDWKRALAILILFIMTGIAIIIYLNQESPQPRERDYSYVGSFFAFAIWIGIGATFILEGIVEFLRKRQRLKELGLIFSAVLVALVVPGNMLRFNYHTHDRSRNYVAYDYSYNILQTCEKNAILFTNGDNDTFPLWFLQYVYNIRPDVRVVNLSLLNTNWYIKQLKHQEPKVPISLTDAQIDNIGPRHWEKRTIEIPVPDELYERELQDLKARGELSGKEKKEGKISFVVNPTLAGRWLRIQDLMVLNIIYSNNWKKPIYFAITVSDGNMVGLGRYAHLRLDGMAFKLMPFSTLGISPSRLRKNYFEVFKFRKLNDPKAFLNTKTMDLLINYRSGLTQLANYYLVNGKPKDAATVLDRMEEIMPMNKIPIEDYRVLRDIGGMYYAAGRPQEFEKRLDLILKKRGIRPEEKFRYAIWFLRDLKNYKKAEEIALQLLQEYPDAISVRILLKEIYKRTKEYGKGIELLGKWVQLHPDDTTAQKALAELQELMTKDSLKIEAAK